MELDYKESWALKDWCFFSVMLVKTLESPLDSKKTKLVNPKGNQSWIFIGRTDAAAETPILWPPDVKNWFFWKDPETGKDWRLEEKGTREDEMVGWHHWLDEHEFEHTPGVGDRQGSLVCCSPWGQKESDTTEWLNWTELYHQTLKLGKIKRRRRRGKWDGWRASPTQWTWIWANSGRRWWIGKPGMLQSMESQRVRHNLVT